MAKPNYSYEKRQRELAKKKKKEECMYASYKQEHIKCRSYPMHPAILSLN